MKAFQFALNAFGSEPALLAKVQNELLAFGSDLLVRQVFAGATS